VAEALPKLYGAEWCPFTSAVREILTELGIDFVACQVEPWPDERSELRAIAGTDEIPVLQVEDGRVFRGTREIFAHLRGRVAWRFAAAHRRRYADHRPAREAEGPGRLIERFRSTDELMEVLDTSSVPE
jgi:glutathione S-transferase